MKRFGAILVCYFVLLLGSAQADVKVVASIKPLHSLVATVMKGAGAPDLLVEGNNSPHTYSLTPSNAALLEQADVIFWFGPELETFLEKPLLSLGQNATVVALLNTPDVTLLPVRQNENFDADEHADEHAGDEHDPHMWLDPENAKVILRVIAETLALKDPEHAKTYENNATAADAAMDLLSTEIASAIAPARGKGFIVFHDAYHYFETRFGVTAVGAIALHPENPPGAATLRNLQHRIMAGQVQCVFAEPQFNDKLVDTLLEGTSARKATLDPLGTMLEAGPRLYPDLLRNIASTMRQCLAP